MLGNRDKRPKSKTKTWGYLDMDFKITMINTPNKIKVGEFYQRTRIS